MVYFFYFFFLETKSACVNGLRIDADILFRIPITVCWIINIFFDLIVLFCENLNLLIH
jgi:hypothetical protein